MWIFKLIKRRCDMDQVKFNTICQLNTLLQHDYNTSLGSRAEINCLPIYLTHRKYSSRNLKKLSVQELFKILKKIINQWSKNVSTRDS